ncbi:MAG: hypothetical protein IKQ77_10255 [Prevotella sp.]|nr:hypothetical protein [Prevotella sp.]
MKIEKAVILKHYSIHQATMGKRIYSQPVTKVLSFEVYGDLCEVSIGDTPSEPDMYGPPWWEDEEEPSE